MSKNFCYLQLCGVLLFFISCHPNVIDVDPARNTNLNPDSFKEELRIGYVKLSDKERERRDRRNADYYGKKALKIVRGYTPPLDDLIHRDLPEDVLNTLAVERNFLVSAFAQEIEKDAPELSAQARLMFDCWAEQEEEKQKHDTRPCRERYFSAKSQITSILEEKEHKKEEEERRIEEKRKKYEAQGRRQLAEQLATLQKKKLKKIMPTSYIVFFRFNSTVLSLSGKRTLEKVAKEYSVFNPRKIIISGHTDRMGGNAYNMRLSHRRAHTIAKFLKQNGLPKDLFDVRSYGENSLHIETSDGKADPQNRYGKILFLRDNRVYYPE